MPDTLDDPALPPGDTDAPAADWPALWGEILQARARSDAGLSSPTSLSNPALDPARWSDASAELLALYAPLLAARAHPQPWLIAQLGQSLDGCIATRSGDSYFVTGAQSLLHLHRLRALCDAVLVGAGTVAADNPQLTTRRVSGPSPTRVVIDPAARLNPRSRVFSDGQAPTLWLCDARHGDTARASLATVPAEGCFRAEAVAIEGLLAPDGGYAPHRVVAALAVRGLFRIFVEGGGVTVSCFLAADCLNRLHLTIAPVLIGSGRPGLTLPARAAMRDWPRFAARVVALGEDRLWDLDVAAASPPLGPVVPAVG